MQNIDRIDFVREPTDGHLRHFVEEADLRVVLSRLHASDWERLKRVVLRRQIGDDRRLGLATGPERTEVHLCALPHRLDLTPYLASDQEAESFGALAGRNWPASAVRRFMLYGVFLQELGHLQVLRPDAASSRHHYASAAHASAFARERREQLWSSPCGHADVAHRPASKEETRELRGGWVDAEEEFNAGQEFERGGDAHAAHAAYRRAVRLYPHHARSLEALGRLTYGGVDVEVKSERFERASQYLERALEIDPAAPDANLYMALVISRTEKPAAARRAFDRVVAADPCGTIAMTGHAEHLSQRGYGDEAEVLFEKVLEKTPRQSSRRDRVLRTYARTLILAGGDGDEARQRYEKATSLLEQAVEIDSTDARNHYFLAWAYSLLGDRKQKAIVHAQEALKLDGDYEAAIQLLAELGVKRPAGE